MSIVTWIKDSLKPADGAETPAARTPEEVIAGLRGLLPIRDDLPTLVSEDMLRANRLAPGQVETRKWPVLHVGEPPAFDQTAWTFRVFGMVKEPVTLSWDEFHALPRVQVLCDMHCVTHWTKFDNLWEGVQGRELIKLVEPDPAARFLMLHGDNGYTANIELDAFLDADVIIGNQHNGQYITAEHGFPMRIVIPKRYLWKGPK